MKVTLLKCPRNDRTDVRYELAEDIQRYRNMIDGYLKELGTELKQPLKLGSLGICAFRFTNFTIVIEVPKHGGCLFVYTVLHQSDPNDRDGSMKFMRTALELNYLQQETGGACISLDKDAGSDVMEFTLSFSHPLMGMDCGEFINIVMNFLATARAVHTKLMAGGQSSTSSDDEGMSLSRSPSI